MNSFMSATKFNSKRYAHKQLENMIENRQSTMGNVYAASKLNQAVDTSDLTFKVRKGTQYKGKHFDPEFEAKEKAKIKTYKEAEM